ncbi:MAG: right-handed parallel beta-helix repeat-containing protein, partial [Candidatus Thorarchaeota archaeon]
MSSKRLIISAIIVLFLVSLIPISTPSLNNLQTEETSVRENIPAGPPSSGEWIITNETTLTGETIDINGRVVIQAGGHLTLQNCIVTMHSQVDWWPKDDMCFFEVWKGGYLTLKNTHVMSGTMYRWYIQADGESGVHIENCHLEGNYPIPDQSYMTGAMINLGGWPTYEPLEYAIIKSNTIENFEGSGIFVQSDGAIITDNNFENLYSRGIDLYKSTNAVITGNHINNVGKDANLNTGEPLGGTGITLRDSDNVTVSYNTITNIGVRGFTWIMDPWVDLYSVPGGLYAFEGNTVDGEPILFSQDESDVVVGSGINEVIIHNSSNVTVQGFNGISCTVTFCDGIIIKDSEFTLAPLKITYC